MLIVIKLSVIIANVFASSSTIWKDIFLWKLFKILFRSWSILKKSAFFEGSIRPHKTLEIKLSLFRSKLERFTGWELLPQQI
jgi:hypothetical protein